MKLKDMVNQNTSEVMKKLLKGLDFNTTYVVEFLHDINVEIREVEKVRDKDTNEIIYIERR